MVALLTSDPIYRSPAPELHPPGRSQDRHLRSIPTAGSRAGLLQHKPQPIAPTISNGAIVWLAVAAILAALLLLVGFRALQGQPPSGSWADVHQAARFEPPVVNQNDAVWTVQPGETLWGIAQSVAPAADRREAVQILAEANGGSSIWAGQQIVIPAGLAEIGLRGEFAASNN